MSAFIKLLQYVRAGYGGVPVRYHGLDGVLPVLKEHQDNVEALAAR